MKTPNKITLGELLEIRPGDKENPSWVNDEFEAVISNISPAQGKGPTKFLLSDPEDPTIRIMACSFGGMVITRYNEKLCLFGGQGMTRTEFNGVQQLTIGAKVTINVIGGIAQASPAPRAANTSIPSPVTRPTASPTTGPINGQTVGMAVKEAVGIVTEGGHDWTAPSTWKFLHEVASDIIRVSRLLEMGKLAPPIRERAEGVLDDRYQHALEAQVEHDARVKQEDEAASDSFAKAHAKAEVMREAQAQDKEAEREANLTDKNGARYDNDEVPF